MFAEAKFNISKTFIAAVLAIIGMFFLSESYNFKYEKTNSEHEALSLTKINTENDQESKRVNSSQGRFSNISEKVSYSIYAKNKSGNIFASGGVGKLITQNGSIRLVNGTETTTCKNGKVVFNPRPVASWSSEYIGIADDSTLLMYANIDTWRGPLRSDARLSITKQDEKGITVEGPAIFFTGRHNRHKEMYMIMEPYTGNNQIIQDTLCVSI